MMGRLIGLAVLERFPGSKSTDSKYIYGHFSFWAVDDLVGNYCFATLVHFRCRPWRCRPPAPSCRPLIPKLDLIQSIKNQKINVQKMKSRPLRYDFKGIRCAMTDSKKYEKVLGFLTFPIKT